MEKLPRDMNTRTALHHRGETAHRPSYCRSRTQGVARRVGDSKASGDDAGSVKIGMLLRSYGTEHCAAPIGCQCMEFKDPDRQRAAQALTLLTLLRRIVVGVSGGLVLIVGVAMTILPGPAIVVVPLGLTILASEFVWARRVIHR